ncbi:MAG: T9SS type A sorting domain-containing protein [Salibacteraceae bacterium]
MFKPLFFTAFLSLAFLANSQPYYEHQISTGTYQELDNPTVIFSGEWNKDNQTQTTMSNTPSFYGFDKTFPNGFVVNGYGALGMANANYSQFFAISGMYANLETHTNGNLSDVSWQIDGEAPNRIFKFQWKNAGFEEDAESYVNFQIWYYEVDGDMEVRYGASSVSSAAYAGYAGPVIGVSYFQSSAVIGDAYHLVGSTDEPTANENPSFPSITGTPADGTIYTFDNLATPNIGIDENEHSTISLYPNPVYNTLNISSSGEVEYLSVLITDLLGKTIYESETIQSTIDVSDFSSGTYLLTVSTKLGYKNTERFIKQ